MFVIVSNFYVRIYCSCVKNLHRSDHLSISLVVLFMMMKFSIFTVGLIFLSTFPELKGRKIHFLIRIDQIPNLDTLLPIGTKISF